MFLSESQFTHHEVRLMVLYPNESWSQNQKYMINIFYRRDLK